MRSGPANGGRATAADVLSPELALVDRGLAQRAREQLLPQHDTIERLERATALRRLTALDAPTDLPVERRSPMARVQRPRAARRTVAGLVAAALIGALLLGVEINLRGSPAGADSTAVSPALPQQTTSPATTPVRDKDGARLRRQKPSHAAPVTARKRTEPAPRRFAWAPVPDASGYHVEFFRAEKRVYFADTSEPQLNLPPSWKVRGRTQRLVPGTYLWYVWPILSGGRAPRATVRAELVVD